MRYSQKKHIDLLDPWISSLLVGTDYRKAIEAITSNLPVLSLGCLECRLGPSEKRVDLNLCINPRVNEHWAMRDHQFENAGISGRAHLKMRERIKAFCGAWSSRGFFLNRLLGELWEVYDLVEPKYGAPAPWLYLSFLRSTLDRDPTIKAEVIFKILSFFQETGRPEFDARFFPFLSSVSPDHRLGCIGMRSERPDILRVYFEFREFDDLAGFLARHHWPGDVGKLKERMAPWVSGRSFFGLTLDLGDAIHPKIGIECHFDKDLLQEDLDAFSRDLCAQGLCDEQKRQAILDWSGEFEAETPPDFWSWPDRFLNDPAKIPRKVRIRRFIPYIKMVYHPQEEMKAKGYLFFIRPVKKDTGHRGGGPVHAS